MKPETISALHDFALKARELLEREVNEQLEGIYGFPPDGKLGPPQKYRALKELSEAQETRKRIEQFLGDEKAVGISPSEARDRLVKEAAFTWLNRLVAFNMMEARGLIRQAVSKGTQSNGFLRWLTEPGNEKDYEKYEQGDLPQNPLGEGPRQEAYRHFLLWQCTQLTREIKVLFDPEILVSRLFPRPGVLGQIIELMSASELEEAWAPGNEETIGWVYQYFNEKDKEKVFDKIYTQKKKMDLRDIPAATQLFTPKWIVRYLVENTLGRLWLRMHPNSDLKKTMQYYVPKDNDKQQIPMKQVKDITFLDPACGTMHFGLVGFDLFYEMYLEEIEKAGKPGWPGKASLSDKSQISGSIIENNLYGIDLDLRSIQLSALTLLIKAKSKYNEASWSRINLTYTDIPEFSEATINHFIDKLQTSHEVTKKILRKILPILNKAYYLGSLLKIENVIEDFVEQEKVALRQQFQLQLFPGMDQKKQTELALTIQKRIIWEQVEKEIVQAFRLFAQTHKEAEGAFVANESMKGLGLIDALIRKHDVVVCNPPYSGRRNMNEVLRKDLKTLYPKKDGDLYTVFIDRCLDLTSERNSFCGMVTVHSFMFTSSHEEIRKEIINNTEIETMAHLGTKTEFDVANKTAQGFSMYALGKIPKVPQIQAAGVYFRLVKENEEEKHTAFCSALRDYLNNKDSFSDHHVSVLQQERLKVIPGWPFVYWVSEGIRNLFAQRLLEKIGYPCVGLQTGDNFRFLRLWWEVGNTKVKIGTASHDEAENSGYIWFPYMKGGEVKRWYGNQEYTVNWRKSGSEIKNFFKDGRLASRPQNLEYCFREGATYSFLTVSNLSVRYLPKGFIFDVAGSSIFPKSDNVFLILGILNSKLSTFLIKLINPTVNYQVGDLARIPVPEASQKPELAQVIEQKVKECVQLKRQEVKHEGTSWEFTCPPSWQSGPYNGLTLEKKLAIIETDISQALYQLYNIDPTDINQIELEYGPLPGKLSKIDDLGDKRLKIIDRLYLEKHVPDEVIVKADMSLETEEADETDEVEESSTKQGRQKRFLTFEELCLASGFHPETVHDYIVANNLERSEERYELAVSWVSYATGILLGRFKPGIKGALGFGIDNDGSLLYPEKFEKLRKLSVNDGTMVMDPGHSDDLPTRVEEALLLLLDESEYKRLIQTLGGDLRRFLEKEFSTKWHIPLYKKRPVYWLLQSPKKTYGIWIFHEKMTSDTLFRIKTEYVVPKINLLESQLAELRKKRDGLAGREKRKMEKEIAELTEILDDVREFLKRLNFIIEERKYMPHIDDGVIMNMAPLWELIPSWQAEPKKVWEALERGDYDWAQQAMDHWPDRVKEKCKTNKSYAIAHGLE